MKKKVIGFITVIVLVLGAFATGVYAAKTDWLSFTGDNKVTESSNHVDEIMEILRQVNEDKLTAEQALAELEALNPPGLVRQIKELKEEIAELDEYIAHLESELTRANDKVSDHNDKTKEALDEAKGYVGGDE